MCRVPLCTSLHLRIFSYLVLATKTTYELFQYQGVFEQRSDKNNNKGDILLGRVPTSFRFESVEHCFPNRFRLENFATMSVNCFTELSLDSELSECGLKRLIWPSKLKIKLFRRTLEQTANRKMLAECRAWRLDYDSAAKTIPAQKLNHTHTL